MHGDSDDPALITHSMKTISFILLAAALLLAGSCSRPKIIADEDLRSIFKEIYLANAFYNNGRINYDSIDIYTPIFEKYGYQPSDMIYTISDFSKRKSSRLSDIINEAIDQLEKEYEWYENKVNILDTIDMIAGERFKRIVYEDSLILVRRISDTGKLRILIPVEEGSYKVEYSYLIDSMDRNGSLRTNHLLRDSAGRQVSTSVNWMKKNNRQHYETKISVVPRARTLELRFGNYGKNLKDISIRIDSLTVTHYLSEKEARDSLTRLLINYKLMVDGKEYSELAQDSSTLSLHAPWLPEKRDSVR